MKLDDTAKKTIHKYRQLEKQALAAAEKYCETYGLEQRYLRFVEFDTDENLIIFERVWSGGPARRTTQVLAIECERQ